jgi:lipase maturation factor 1
VKWVGFGSGPKVARLFHKLLALIFLDAWISLGLQWKVLVGARGLLPAQPFIDAVHQAQVPFWQVPTIFFWGAPDWALSLGIWIGAALALAALFGVVPRALFGVSTLLYLSYATIGRTFLSFQWDNLLLECGCFATLLPADREAPVVHLLFRLILFKLYWESGLAKWQSHLHDWQDGSAMTFYYETAPLPAALAFYAHHAPVWWHHFESWATLFFELVLPFAIFSPRRVRQFAAVFFTFFQVINALTANYGFFCYLACALHVFLLDDALLARVWNLPTRPPQRRWTIPVVVVFVFISLVEGAGTFTHWEPSAALSKVGALWAPLRVVNTYHLFAHITRERIEPELQTFSAGEWQVHDLYYKPGPLDRRPPYVAPHQPRVDFQLWFYGLDHRRGSPEYVVNLLKRLCRDPAAVQPLFTHPLPAHPDAVRIVYWQYHFADRPWWRREHLDETRAIGCDKLPQ